MVLSSSADSYDGFKGTYIVGVMNSEVGECMGVLEALRWIKSLGIENIHIEKGGV